MLEDAVKSLETDSHPRNGPLRREIQEHKRTAEVSRQNEIFQAAILDGVRAGVIVIEAEEKRIADANAFALQMLGRSKEELIGQHCYDTFCPGTPGQCLMLRSRNGAEMTECVVIGSDHRKIPVLKSQASIERADQRYLVESFIDISSLKQAEKEKAELSDQLRQSQKMEALGRLAGGVAHDFNNLLTAISGYSQMLVYALDAIDPELKKHAQEIEKAAERAAELTQQLLTVSRKQPFNPKPVDLNHAILDLDNMLRRVIGEDIELRHELAGDLGLVRSDPSQIVQVILNLAINARDAMPKGGTLELSTFRVEVDAVRAERMGLERPGPYARLIVKDSGCGIPREVVGRIFEPFFTTKPKGKGTGLGLATVYGIVTQNKGVIRVQSTPGAGTRFDIFLPCSADSLPVKRTEPLPMSARKGSGTILLAEDTENVREFFVLALQDSGYEVICANNGPEALQIASELERPVDLLLSDVIMPRMNGMELARRLRQLWPDLKTIFMTGYFDESTNGGDPVPNSVMLMKPFTIDVLCQTIQSALAEEEKT